MTDTHPAPIPSLEPALTPRPIDPGVCIGHVHLKVADLDRAASSALS